jgi:hypothetical protein
VNKFRKLKRTEAIWVAFEKSGLGDKDFITRKVVTLAWTALGFSQYEMPDEIEFYVKKGIRADVAQVVLHRKDAEGHRLFYSFLIDGKSVFYRHRSRCTPDEKREFANRHGEKGQAFIKEKAWILELADAEEMAIKRGRVKA